MMNLSDVEMVKFHPNHLEVAYLRERERKFFDVPEMYERVKNLSENSHKAVTLLHEGRILTFCGYLIVSPGVAEMWQIPSIYARRYPKHYCSTLKIFIDFAIMESRLFRLQTIAPDDEAHRLWMEYIGFHEEGRNEKLMNKEDFIMWAKIIKENL